MEPAAWINDFLAWAWERHNNVLSRYIRSLFVLPLARRWVLAASSTER